MFLSAQYFSLLYFISTVQKIMAPVKLDLEKHFRSIENTGKHLEGKTGEAAKLALLDIDLGYVNYDSEESESVLLSMIRDYNEIKSGHKIQIKPMKPTELAEKKDSEKIDMCKTYLNEPLLRETGFFYDEYASADKIKLVEKLVVYRHHGKETDVQVFIQCPYRFKYDNWGYLYFSFLEKQAHVNEADYYFYVFTEYRNPPTDEVAILMRSKMNAGILLTEFVNTLKKTKNTIQSIINNA